MNWIPITSQIEADELISRIDWEDAFVREAYLVSPSYIDPTDGGTVAADSLPSCKILIHFPGDNHGALEFLMIGVEAIGIWFDGPLKPAIAVGSDGVEFALSTSAATKIKAKELRYLLQGKETWGHDVHYGKEGMFDLGGFPKD
jgi:hypothetical protein